ncbi:hypothetical protein CBL_20841 [Carabus blaptoides fortunei]
MPHPTAPRTRSKDGKTEIRTSTKPDAKRETAARSKSKLLKLKLQERESSPKVGKRDADVINVVIELPMLAWKRLVEAERVFIGWSSYKVRDYEVVQRCYGCYGYGYRLTECKLKGIVCRKYGRIGHTQLECDNDDVWCRNCKVKNNEANHEVMSIECPEYKNALARMRNATYYG